MACDICGKTDSTLDNIMPIYQSKDIVNLCSNCVDILSKFKDERLSVYFKTLETDVQNYARNLKAGYPELKPPPRPPACILPKRPIPKDVYEYGLPNINWRWASIIFFIFVATAMIIYGTN